MQSHDISYKNIDNNPDVYPPVLGYGCHLTFIEISAVEKFMKYQIAVCTNRAS